MFSANVIIPNETGLHARPASGLVQLSKDFKSKIEIHYKTKIIDAKSIINVMAGGLSQHAEIEVTACGEDEQAAGQAIVSYIENLRD